MKIVKELKEIQKKRIYKDMKENKKYEFYDVKAEMFLADPECYPDTIVFKILWEANVGFGELTFTYNTKTLEFDYDSECMSKEFCIEVVNKCFEEIMSEKG